MIFIDNVVIWMLVLVKSSMNLPLKISTTQENFTTQPPSTTTQQKVDPLCFSDRFPFSKSDVVDEGYSSKTKTCWQIHCGEEGRLIKSITPCDRLETFKALTTPSSTIRLDITECVFNGRSYKPGEDVQTLSDWQSDRCYGTRCNKFGEIVAWETFNCYSTPYYSTTTESSSKISTNFGDSSSTTPPTSTTSLDGCYDNSIIYHPGEEISYEYFKENQTCCGKYCNFDNKIITWRGINCDVHSPVHTKEISTTQLSITEGQGCYDKGKHYKLNMNIDSGNDGVRWCFGRYCNEQSKIVYWDDFDCDITSFKMTSTPTSTDNTMTTSQQKNDNTKMTSQSTDSLKQMNLKEKNEAFDKDGNEKTLKSFLLKLIENFPFFPTS